MASSVSLPEEPDRQLEAAAAAAAAAAAHVSKNSLLAQDAVTVVERHARRQEIGDGLDFVVSHDSELLNRLEDA